jgi:hypothetical protein
MINMLWEIVLLMSMSAGAGGNLPILARTHSQQNKRPRHARWMFTRPCSCTRNWVVCAAIPAICPWGSGQRNRWWVENRSQVNKQTNPLSTTQPHHHSVSNHSHIYCFSYDVMFTDCVSWGHLMHLLLPLHTCVMLAARLVSSLMICFHSPCRLSLAVSQTKWVHTNILTTFSCNFLSVCNRLGLGLYRTVISST